MVPGTSKGLTAPTPISKLEIRNGWVVCPICKQNKHLLRVHPETEARNLEVFCRYCKSRVILDIPRQGQSLKDQSR